MAPLVSENLGMRYYGQVLGLMNFQGPVVISDNIFEQNKLHHEGCSKVVSLLESASFINQGSAFDQIFSTYAKIIAFADGESEIERSYAS